jgi:AraC-like DNA-binding protein
VAATWPHVLPPVLAGVLAVLWPAALDLAIIAVYLGYAAALLRLVRRGPDGLGLAPLEGVVPAYRALQIAVAALVASAMVDVIILLDFEWTHGRHAASVVGIANLAGLLALGLAAVVAGRIPLPVETAAPASVETGEPGDDDKVVEKIDDLLRSHELFRDASLNLARLARKAGLAPRRISVAVNRLRARNVSQYINGFRTAEACRLLTETDRPVTSIMFDAGFQTKSNFNREFRRVTGMSPMAWRSHNADAGASTAPSHRADRHS